MADFHGQTVDLWEPFTDETLETGLSKWDPNGSILIPSGGKMRVAHEVGGDSIIQLYRTESAISFGFRYTTMHGFTYSGPELFRVTQSTGAALRIQEHIGYLDPDTHAFRIVDDTEHDVIVAPDTEYWITAYFTRNGTCRFRVYNLSTHAQIGSEVTMVSGDYAATEQWLGQFNAGVVAGVYVYADDYVIDWTDATYPLLGWDVAGNPFPTFDAAYGQQ